MVKITSNPPPFISAIFPPINLKTDTYAKSEGVKAKSDPIDSQMILQFAHEKKLRKLSPPDPVREHMAALMDRRTK